MIARLYACALLAFPPAHRRRYAAEMHAAFVAALRAERRNSRLAALRFVVAAVIDAVVTGVGARWDYYRANPATTKGVSRLDVVLAWRMMARYPGVSIISVFGIAVGIAVSTISFTFITAMMETTLPLPEGDRIVSIIEWDMSTTNREEHMLRDFTVLRGLTTVEDLALTRTVERNLMVGGQPPQPVKVAEISASAFRAARVAAIRGRHLLEEDERLDAPNALVIGHDEWVRRFDADPAILGRTVQLGSSTYTVVGVMPEGFLLPTNHQFWIPWRIDASAFQPRTGPAVIVFGRLREGATLDAAQAELTTIGHRLSASFPDTHEHLRPWVKPYATAFNDMADPMNALALYALQLSIVLLLVVVCVNVAILVYARTTARHGEIAVRSALGASRSRIVAQLFVEALIVTGIAAAIGVGLAATALERLDHYMRLISSDLLPFWMSLELSANDVFYVTALTLAAAAIVGVVPALKATGAHVQARLQTLSAGGRSRMQMGRVWTTLIVAQVALTVALLPAAMYHAWTALSFRTGDAGFAATEFLTARLVLDRTATAPGDDGEREFAKRLAHAHGEIERRLEQQAAVSAATFSLAAAGEERAAVAEIEGRDSPDELVRYNIVAGTKRGHLVRFNRVGIDFFDAFDVPIMTGRGFRAADIDPDARHTTQSVLVNRAFVDLAMGGGNPLGRRIRYVGRSREANERDIVLDRWYEIVGVVPDFPTSRTLDSDREQRIYHAAAFGDVYPAELAVRMRLADPMAFAATLREVGSAVDPDIELRDVVTAEMILEREQGLSRLIGITVALVMVSVIVLAAAGIYALMSFTVERRRREIGIRAALGADRNRILTGIFARAIGQLAAGGVIGMAAAVGIEELLEGEMFQGQGAVILPAVVSTMVVVGLLAALGPARRGLSIQPIEALRDE